MVGLQPSADREVGEGSRLPLEGSTQNCRRGRKGCTVPAADQTPVTPSSPATPTPQFTSIHSNLHPACPTTEHKTGALLICNAASFQRLPPLPPPTPISPPSSPAAVPITTEYKAQAYLLPNAAWLQFSPRPLTSRLTTLPLTTKDKAKALLLCHAAVNGVRLLKVIRSKSPKVVPAGLEAITSRTTVITDSAAAASTSS